jgi:hypothetical protein
MKPPKVCTVLSRALCVGTTDCHEHGRTGGSDFAQPEAIVFKCLQKDHECLQIIFDDPGVYVLGIKEEANIDPNADAWHPSMD